MAIDERSRKQMHDALERVLGPREAATLMEHLPPVGWADVATKRDLDAMRHELRAELHSGLRTQLLAFTTIMALLNGVTFTAFQLL